jgi:hypothetical protein
MLLLPVTFASSALLHDTTSGFIFLRLEEWEGNGTALPQI